MTSKFTSGPWTMDGRLVIDTRGDAVAMVNIARPVDVAHCDARLIAASPELLDALRGLLDSLIDEDFPLSAHAIGKARDAIAKAIGVAP